MKRTKFLSFLLAALLVLSSFSCLSVVSFAAELVDSGYTPDSENAENPENRITSWEFYDDGVLYIYDNPGGVPWAKYADQILSVVLKGKADGESCKLTALPGKAFYGYENLASVDFRGASGSLQIIGAHAFDGCTSITDIKLPNSVITIEDYAFYACPNLRTVKLSASLKNVGKNVFKGCKALETVDVPNGVITIGYGMFEDCSVLATIELPDSVEAINAHAFEGCSALKEIVIPDSVVDLGDYAFYESGITKAYVGHSVTNVGSYVFGRCSALEEVTFTSGINTIGEWMFYDCTSLATIVDFPESVKVIGAHAFEGCSALTAVAIPNTVVEIGDSAFAGCSTLADVTLSTALTKIGANAFNGASVTAIDIPYGVQEIGAGAFANCSALTAINVASANTAYKSLDGVLYTVDMGILILCPAGKTGEVVISDATNSIYSNAFLGCTGITSVTIPASVQSIDATAFNGCSDDLVIKTLCSAYAAEYAKLFGIDTEITHTGEIEWVVTAEPDCENYGEKTAKCADCKEVQGAPELIAPLGHSYDAGVVTKKATCTENGVVTFTCEHEGCLDSYTEDIPATGHKMDSGIVLQEPTCDDNGKRRFSCQNEGCYYYEDYDIPATGHSYDNGTITVAPTCETAGEIVYKCTDPACTNSYKDVIPATGHKLGAEVEAKAPLCEEDGYVIQKCENDDCSYVKTTIVPATEHKYDKGAITKYPTVHENGEYTYTCQNEWCTEDHTNHVKVFEIETNAFDGILDTNDGAYADDKGIQNLTWILTDEYDLYVFADVDANEWSDHRALIETVTFTDKATTVANGSFAGMPKLREANILLNLGTIEAYAFQYCPALETVVTGSIKTIGDYAFYECDALTYVDIYGGLEEVGKNIFKSCDKLEEVIIRNGSLNIGYGMFEDCLSLKTVDLPDSLVTIGELAFDDCISLEAITVPDSVHTVGRYAFHNCSSAKTAYIGHNAEDIGEYAFSGCSSLENVEIACAMRVFPEGMFMNCKALASIELEEGVEEIRKNAFKDCSALAEINLPSTVKTIGDSAFDGTALKEINIPADVELIDRGAFTNCNSLTAINVDDKNDFYFSVDGVLYDVRLNTLMLCPAGKKGEVAVWHTTTAVADDAFIGCKGITKVTIPNSVMQIGANAFNNCATNIIIKGNCDSQGIVFAKARGMATEINHVAGLVWQTKVEPNCLEKGMDELVCAGCGDISETKETDALGHNYNSGVITTDPTCDADGVMTYTCQREGCTASYTKPIPATKHNFDSGKVISAPTCEEKGTMRYSCQNAGCLESYDEDIKALGHSMDAGTVITPVTCEADGLKVYKCTNTGCLHEVEEVLTKLGHNYVATEIKKATCLENGKLQYTCGNCGDSYIETTVGEHLPYSKPVTVAPTCTEKGKTGDRCSLCGQFFGTVTEIPATGHSYVNGTCTGCGDKSATQQPSNPGGTVVTPEGGSNNNNSGTNNPVAAKPATPKLLLLMNRNEGLVLTWRAVDGAKAYRVYRRGAGEKSWTYLTTVTDTTFVDSKAETGKYWRYTVRATNDAGYSGFENGLYIKRVDTPHMTGISNVATGIKISWSSISNAKSYKIYRRGVGESWKCIATVGASVTSYTDSTIKNNSGNYYRYTVRAIDGYYSYFESGLFTKFVAAPHLKSVAKTSNGVKVTWGAVNGADTYRVYRRGAGQSWVYVTTVTGTSYVDTSVKNATGYYRYTVRAVDSGRYSGYETGLLIKK